MNMNRAFYLRKEDSRPQWRVIDADGKVLGRLATLISEILRGKDKPIYTPHADAGDYVVVINAEKVKLTGNKLSTKIYDRYTGWMGGYKTQTAGELLRRKPTELLFLAVKRMLRANRLNRALLRKLKLYSGPRHPHQAQVATTNNTAA